MHLPLQSLFWVDVPLLTLSEFIRHDYPGLPSFKLQRFYVPPSLLPTRQPYVILVFIPPRFYFDTSQILSWLCYNLKNTLNFFLLKNLHTPYEACRLSDFFEL